MNFSISNIEKGSFALSTIIMVVLSIAVLSLTGCKQDLKQDWDKPPQDMTAAMGVVPDSLQSMSLAPLVKGYYRGEDLYFIHTETSDSSVASLLSDMMGRKVVHLPKLAKTPDTLRAAIYVFKNGIEGHGPYGYQPDVFGSAPGNPAYSPLREIYLVRWKETAEAREFKKASSIKKAEENGKLNIKKTGIVVNMPVLAWNGKHR